MSDEKQIIKASGDKIVSNNRKSANFKLKEKSILYMQECIDEAIIYIKEQNIGEPLPSSNLVGIKISVKNDRALWLAENGKLYVIHDATVEDDLKEALPLEKVDEQYLGSDKFTEKLSNIYFNIAQKSDKQITRWLKTLKQKEEHEKIKRELIAQASDNSR